MTSWKNVHSFITVEVQRHTAPASLYHQNQIPSKNSLKGFLYRLLQIKVRSEVDPQKSSRHSSLTFLL